LAGSVAADEPRTCGAYRTELPTGLGKLHDNLLELDSDHNRTELPTSLGKLHDNLLGSVVLTKAGAYQPVLDAAPALISADTAVKTANSRGDSFFMLFSFRVIAASASYQPVFDAPATLISAETAVSAASRRGEYLFMACSLSSSGRVTRIRASDCATRREETIGTLTEAVRTKPSSAPYRVRRGGDAQ
jgi:hypothetical protein